ncbi:SDR family oxidoreductase [Wenzhouxiangella sp. XN201]|uniref:SDR family oxidoreductase n=1 Tax=Wenzhouxiangella sp. XN201 TaxID=2710755 RepID=UPI0013C6800D|nr:SDR family oxidoreductase [Wenzhouxiangella sp. XN201]NEZ03532.1 SDR family oxidoreductase [Wenzhouxiangella sp. XN201]
MTKTIVITGCSSGFGKQLALQLARRGDRVYATMRATQGKNAVAAEELNNAAETEDIDLRVLELDVASTGSVNAAAKAILAESGAPDVVVNNAGVMYVGFTEAFTAEELTTQLDVNVVGIQRMNRAFLPAMRQRGQGLIVNLSSIAGRFGVPFFGVYHASKWALEGYSMALRCELARCGIDVVVVEPGPFATELFTTSPRPTDADGRIDMYPAVARETFEDLMQGFDGMFSDPDTPTEPALVVEQMVALIDAPAGSRPFRTVAGVDVGVRERNAAVEPFDAAVLEAFGLTEFATLAGRHD